MSDCVLFNFLYKENFKECIFKIPGNLTEEKISNLILKIKDLLKKERDNIQVAIYNNLEYDDLNEEKIKEELKMIEEGTIIKVIIRKIFKEKTLSIYSLKNFSEYIENLSLEDTIIIFSDYFEQNSVTYYELVTDKVQFNTPKIFFGNIFQNVINSHIDEKEYILKEKDELCNIHSKVAKILPDNFYLLNKSGHSTKIEKIFYKLTVLLSIISIANLSFVIKNELDYEINSSYKTLKNRINLQIDDISPEVADILFQIYSWIYEQETSILERMQVSRDVITLYSVEDDLLKLNPNIIYSIKSTYEIYLKKYVDRYVKILEDISLLLDELENKFILTKDEFKNKFKNTLLTFFTFIFSTLLFNTLSTGKIENIFTKDITILSIALIFFSILYFYISVKELDSNFNDLKKSYKRKQKYFNGILNRNDIEQLFSKSDFLKESEEEIKNLKICCIKLGSLSITIFVIILFLLVEEDVVTSLAENIKIFLKVLSTNN